LDKIGKLTISLLISSGLEEEKNLKKIKDLGYKVMCRQSWCHENDIIIAAIETAARRELIYRKEISYREEHALYHAIIEALKGLCRGEIGGDLLKSIGIKFVILRGPLEINRNNLGEWMSVGIC
jgi:hut operon positive regulatory protein